MNYLLQQISCGKNYFKDRIILFLWDSAGNLFSRTIFQTQNFDLCFNFQKSQSLWVIQSTMEYCVSLLREEKKVGQQRIMVVWINKITHCPVTNLVNISWRYPGNVRTRAGRWYKRIWGVYRDWNDVIRLRCSTPFSNNDTIKSHYKIKTGFPGKT